MLDRRGRTSGRCKIRLQSRDQRRGKRTHNERIAMNDAIKHVSDATFDKDVLQSGNPVLVDFWAEWCGPCKMFAPVLDEIAKEYDGKLTIAKLDIDANPSTPG